MEKYYFPISSKVLAHYFGCACIKPSKYFDNKPDDLQDKFKDFLLITTNFGTQATNCCLELIFTEQEISELIDIQNGFYLYEKPLPITRIKGIFFVDKEQKEQTIININMSTAFVPESLVQVVDKFDNTPIDKTEQPADIHINLFDKQIQTFDSFLGGFALLRYAGEDYMNYSENYFSTLAVYNSKIKSELPNNTHLKNLFENPLFKEASPFLRKKIDDTIVTEQAEKENQDINRAKDKFTRKIDLNQLNNVTYILAALNTFSVGQESKALKIDDLILSNFKSRIQPDKSEIFALCYGINRGYSVFSKSYGSKSIKFKLDSQLDYYTIESLYQFSFYEKKNNFNFPYLDWCPKQKWTKPSKNTDYKILDVVVIGKRKAKVLSKEYWANLLPSFLQSNKLSEKTLPQIYQELGEAVFNDAKEEIVEEFEFQISLKQEEIEKLKAEQQFQKAAPIKEYKQEEKPMQTVAEPQAVYNTTKNEVKQIIEQFLAYKEKGRKSLEDEAKNKGIDVKSKKIDEIIILLMTATPEPKLDLQ